MSTPATSVTIASLYWEDLKHQFPYADLDKERGSNEKILPACRDRKTPSTLVVTAMKEKRYVGAGRYMMVVDHATTAPVLAADLVRRWRDNVPLGSFGGPAVWICEGPEPTAAECKYWGDIQKAWARAGCNVAQGLWIQGKRDEVARAHNLYKMMAWYLNVNDYEWTKDPAAVTMVNCPFCKQAIPDDAPICAHCNKVANPVLLKKVESTMERDLELYEATMKQQEQMLQSPEPEPAPIEGPMVQPFDIANAKTIPPPPVLRTKPAASPR